MTTKRIYVMTKTTDNGPFGLVRAASRAQAIAHIVNNTIHASVASAEDVAYLIGRFPVQDAGPEQQVIPTDGIIVPSGSIP